MAVLNITYAGRSGNVLDRVDDNISDAEVRRLAVEVLRTGGVVDLEARPSLALSEFDDFVVDRIDTMIFLRPKVPFGQA